MLSSPAIITTSGPFTVENVPVAFNPEMLKEGWASLVGNLPVAFGAEMLKEG
jgi:hypothetical protein